MTIRGIVVYEAQVAVISTSDTYLTLLTQRVMHERQSTRLQDMISRIKDNEKAFRLLKASMTQRSLGMRFLIVLDLQQYQDAYAWHALKTDRIIVSDPMKDVGFFMNDASILQANVAQVSADYHSQSRSFQFSWSSAKGAGDEPSQDPSASFSSVLWTDFSRTRTFSFRVDPNSKAFQRFFRIRMTAFKIFLKDSASGANAAQPLSLKVVLGREMSDLKHMDSLTASRIANFITLQTTFGFEYVPSSREVILAGKSAGERQTSLTSPFRQYTVTVNDASVLEGATGFDLEIECLVSYQ